jgi:hypothetical protein
MFLDFIPTWIWGIILVLGILGLLFKNKLSNMLGGVGSVVGLNRQTTLMVFVVLAIVAGGFGFITSMISGFGIGAATVTGNGAQPLPAGATFGNMNVLIHDGLVNATTTSDSVDASNKFMTIYTTDANIAEADYYAWNLTVGRDSVTDASTVKVVCTVPNKDLTASEDSLALKSAGKIVASFVGARDSGTVEGNSVTTYIDYDVGTGSANIQFKFEQDESYEDAMTPYQDYVDATCVLTSDTGSDSTVTRIYAAD